MKRYLKPEELSPDSSPLVRATREYLGRRRSEANVATATVLDELATELDRLWKRTAVEQAWANFWRKFKLNGFTAADLYDVKFFLAESFPEHLSSIEVHAEEQYVAVAVDMDDYTLRTNVPVVPSKPSTPPVNKTERTSI